MANKQRGEITITLGSKQYTMRPTFEAMCEMEDRLNGSMAELVVRIQNGDIKFKTIATIIWCGIHGYQNDGYGDEVEPTLAVIGNAIRQHGLTKVISEGAEEGKNPIVNFMSRGLMGDEEAEKLSAQAEGAQPGKEKPKADHK